MNTYNKKHINDIALATGYIRDNVEKVMRLTDILAFIQSDYLLHSHLILKGGTALNLFVFSLPRLSVDIDLDYIGEESADSLGEIKRVVNGKIVSFMESEGYSVATGSKHPHSLDSWVFSYINAAGNRDNIKIEINWMNRCHVLEEQEYALSNPHFKGVSVKAMAPLELYASKIKALIERGAARDLFDVDSIIPLLHEEDKDMLRKMILFYLAAGKGIPEHGDWTKKLEVMTFKDIRTSLLPVLRKGTFYDYQSVMERVSAYIKELMILIPSEQEFAEQYAAGYYNPDLLFEDKTTADKVRRHPAIMWNLQKSK